MTYFFFEYDTLLDLDDLFNEIIDYKADDIPLVNEIKEDGVYVWNEDELSVWYDEEHDPYDRPCRIQQFINKKLVNDAYYTAVDEELMPLYSNKTVYDNNHPSDEDLLTHAEGRYLFMDWGIDDFEEHSIEWNLDTLCGFLSGWVADVNNDWRNAAPTCDTGRVDVNGLYLLHLPIYDTYRLDSEQLKYYNQAFLYKDGKIILKANVQDILDSNGQISGLTKWKILEKYDIR